MNIFSHQGFGPIEEEEMDHILGQHAYSFDVRKSSDGNYNLFVYHYHYSYGISWGNRVIIDDQTR